MMYVENYLLAKAWYVAQIFPPHSDSLRQIRLAIVWYIWRGEIFRVPLSTLYVTKETGGWNLTHVEAKCRTLLIHRLQSQGEIEGSVTNWWLNRWRLKHHSNPPHPPSSPNTKAIGILAYPDNRHGILRSPGTDGNNKKIPTTNLWSDSKHIEQGDTPHEHANRNKMAWHGLGSSMEELVDGPDNW